MEGMSDSDSGVQPASATPCAAVLQSWSSHDWRGGVHIGTLSALDRLTVRTRNSVYEIVVSSPQTGEVMIKGGAFFPSFTPARLCGSSLGGSFLKLGIVHPGFCLEFSTRETGIVVTTPVRTLVHTAAESALTTAVM
jgi:hypothetical protein